MRSLAVTFNLNGRILLVFLLLLMLGGIVGGVVMQRQSSAGELSARVALPDDPVASASAFQRTELPLSALPRDRLMVALAFGQSNSANWGSTLRVAGERVFNLSGGKLYRAQDPLLGADGNGGSIWTRLGDKLIQQGLYDGVVFVSVGVGGTPIARWAPGGDLHQRILDGISEARAAGLTFTHLLWEQGETDAGLKTTKDQYKSMFEGMLLSIRGQGVKAPIYVSTATRCAYDDPNGSPEIRQAQAELVDPSRGILAGPDTDTLWDSYRQPDQCHFSDAGLEQAAELWLKALAASPETH